MGNLTDVCDVNPDVINPIDRFKSGDFVYIDISSVDEGKVSFENVVKVGDAPSRARRGVKDLDVVISTVRPNLKAFALLEKLPERCIASTGFAVLRPKPMLKSRYLAKIVFSEDVLNQMIANMGKGAYPSINQADVENIRIPLPSIEEQEEIAVRLAQEEAQIESTQRLFESFKNKINDKISEVWGK